MGFKVASCGLAAPQHSISGRSKGIPQPNAEGFLLRLVMAEEMGFEPMNPCGLTVFKTVAFVHSATPPLEWNQWQELAPA